MLLVIMLIGCGVFVFWGTLIQKANACGRRRFVPWYRALQGDLEWNAEYLAIFPHRVIGAALPIVENGARAPATIDQMEMRSRTMGMSVNHRLHIFALKHRNDPALGYVHDFHTQCFLVRRTFASQVLRDPIAHDERKRGDGRLEKAVA